MPESDRLFEVPSGLRIVNPLELRERKCYAASAGARFVPGDYQAPPAGSEIHIRCVHVCMWLSDVCWHRVMRAHSSSISNARHVTLTPTHLASLEEACLAVMCGV